LNYASVFSSMRGKVVMTHYIQKKLDAARKTSLSRIRPPVITGTGVDVLVMSPGFSGIFARRYHETRHPVPPSSWGCQAHIRAHVSGDTRCFEDFSFAGHTCCGRWLTRTTDRRQEGSNQSQGHLVCKGCRRRIVPLLKDSVWIWDLSVLSGEYTVY
jgi:hypothetical protein